MSQSSPAGPSRAVRATPTPAPAPRKHLIQDGDGPTKAPSPRVIKPKKSRTPLSERLPEGVYDNRPRYKRFVFHWLYFWAWARLGLYKTKLPAPKVSLREQFDRNDQTLFDLGQRKEGFGAGANSKGGAGKTPFCSWVIVTVDHHTKKSTLLLEANENAGNGAATLGVDRSNTLTLRSYLASLESFDSHDALDGALGHHRHTSTAVIASDPNSNLRITGRKYVEGALNAKRCYRFVMQDLGNGLGNQANLGAMRVASVPFVVASIAKPTSFTDADSTYAAYRDRYKLADKMVDKAIPVFLGVKRRQLPKLIEQHDFSFDADRIRLVSYDRYMARENVVDLRKLRLRTRVDLQKIAIEWLEKSPDVDEPTIVNVDLEFEAYEDDTEYEDTATASGPILRGM